MPTDQQKIEQSRKAGYSDDQILDFLSKQPGYSEKIQASAKAGYKPDQIINFLGKRKEDTSSLIGKEGNLVGGQAGETALLAQKAPIQLLAQLPAIAADFATAPAVGLPNFVAEMASKVLGQPNPPPERETVLSHLIPPEKTPNLSDIAGDFAAEDLPPELQDAARAYRSLAGLIAPFIGKGVAKGVQGAKRIAAKPKAPKSPGGGPAPGSGNPPGSNLKAAASDIGEKLKVSGKALKEKIFGPNISEEIPKSLSRERIKNTTSAGMELEKAVAKPYEELTKQENQAYEVSKKANKSIEAIHPELVHDLQASIEELSKIPDPSSPLKRYIISSRKLLRDLAEIDEAGTIHGYKPISNQILIDQIQEYNQIPQFDFPTDTKTGIFKSLIKKTTKAVDETAAKHPKANKAWKEAKEIHARKSELFADRDVAKWTKLADKNYSAEFSSSINIDKIRKLEPVLKRTAEGRGVLQKLKREIVERMFKDYFPVGKRFDKAEISRAMAELEPILTADELKVIEQLFKEAQTPGAEAASIVSKFYRYLKRPSTAVKEIGKIT